MKKLIQTVLLKLFAGARRKRLAIEIKQHKALMLEAINLPNMQRKRVIKKKLWDYRKKMDTPEGQYISWWCDAVKQAGKAIDALRKKDGNPNLVMSDINFHEEHYEKATASDPNLSGDQSLRG